MTPFFFKKKRKRRCPEAARCRFFAAVSATVIGVSRRLQLEKEKQTARDTSEHLITCDRKMFISTFGFLETPPDENRCLHNRKWRRKTLLASSTWSWNPNVPNLTDPRRCLDRNEKTRSPSRRKLFQKRSTSKNVFSWVPSRKNYRHRHKNWPKDAKRQNDSFFNFTKSMCSHLQRKRRRKVGACA